jgi:hypothetical protein
VLPLFQSKATINTYSECEFTALGLQHAMCLRHIVVRGLTGCLICFHYLKKVQFWKKKDIEHKMSVLIFSKIFIKNISHSKHNSA